MCILILKEKGVAFPNETIIRNCMDANPDGFSMSFNDGDKVFTYSSLDDKDFLEEYRIVTEVLNHRDTAMMLHMRIATHGSVKLKNCHGWKGNILGAEMAFAHNGILSIKNREDMTDSETFLRDYLEPCESFAEVMQTITKHIGHSKFGFIDGNGNIAHFGQFQKDRGVLYSNGSFRQSRYSQQLADPRLWMRYNNLNQRL